MRKNVITVAPTMTVKTLAMTLIKNQISGAPVAAKNGKIIGVVSEADIVVKKSKDVKPIMSKKVIRIMEDTTVEEIAQLITTHAVKRLPVVACLRLAIKIRGGYHDRDQERGLLRSAKKTPR